MDGTWLWMMVIYSRAAITESLDFRAAPFSLQCSFASPEDLTTNRSRLHGPAARTQALSDTYRVYLKFGAGQHELQCPARGDFLPGVFFLGAAERLRFQFFLIV